MMWRWLRQLRYAGIGLRCRLALLEWRSIKADLPGLNSPEALHLPIANAAIPSRLRKRIEATISERLEPVSPLPSHPILAGQLLVLSVASVALGAWWLGGAGWRALSEGQISIIFSLLTVGMLLLADTASREMIPGSRQQVSPLLTTFLPLLALLFAILLIFPYAWNPNFVTLGLRCWLRGLLCATISGPLILLILRRGALLSPLWQGATAGLLAGLVELTVLEIYCPYLDRAHVAVWHCGAALTAMCVGAAIAIFSARFMACADAAWRL